jgi:hypothetical protein
MSSTHNPYKTLISKKGAGKGYNNGGPSRIRKGQDTEVLSKGTESVQNTQANTAQGNEEQAEIPSSNEEGGNANQSEANQGSPTNPSYAEIARKKPVESSESSEDETFERPLKKAGRKSRKEKREEEAERYKTQGSQSTIEMSIGRNIRARPSKGGPNPPPPPPGK